MIGSKSIGPDFLKSFQARSLTVKTCAVRKTSVGAINWYVQLTPPAGRGAQASPALRNGVSWSPKTWLPISTRGCGGLSNCRENPDPELNVRFTIEFPSGLGVAVIVASET